MLPHRGNTAPVPIADAHDTTQFSCGHDQLDAWLKSRANKAEGLSGRTYVICNGALVVGYYTLATGAEKRDRTPGKIRRNSPDQIPLMLLARLAVDARYTGQGLGGGLLKDAFARTIQVAGIAGIRALMVQAIDGDAKRFYEKFDFQEFPDGSLSLYLPVEKIQRLL